MRALLLCLSLAACGAVSAEDTVVVSQDYACSAQGELLVVNLNASDEVIDVKRHPDPDARCWETAVDRALAEQQQ